MAKMNVARKCLNCNLDGSSDCPGNCADYTTTSKLQFALQTILAVILWVPLLIVCFILIIMDWLSRATAQKGEK